MTATLAEPVEVDLDHEGIYHVVCHCTDDNIAACGLDVSDRPLTRDVDDDKLECPMCALAWPVEAPTCPWGCSCEEDCGPFEDAGPGFHYWIDEIQRFQG